MSEIATTNIRELADEEIFAVSGGKVTAGEVVGLFAAGVAIGVAIGIFVLENVE